MYKNFTILSFMVMLVTGCSEQQKQSNVVKDTNTTLTKKVVYGDKTDIDLTGIDKSAINVNCDGAIAFVGLNNQFMTNAYDWKIVDIKSINNNPKENECEARYFAINQDQGIFGQEQIFYKISEENGKYSIAIKEINGTPIAPNDTVALDYSCGGINAKTLVEYVIGLEYSQQTGIIPAISVDSIVTESKSNNSAICDATITVFNPDENAPMSESVLNVENLHYKIMLTDDRKNITFKRL